MKKMIHVYENVKTLKNATDRVVKIKGLGVELLEDFAAICGTLANSLDEAGLSQERIVSILSTKMAQGISERHQHKREED